MKKTYPCDPEFYKIAVDILQVFDFFNNELPGIVKNSSPAEAANWHDRLIFIRANVLWFLEHLEKSTFRNAEIYELISIFQKMIGDSDKYLLILKEKGCNPELRAKLSVDEILKTGISNDIEFKISIEDMHYTTLHCRYTTSPKYHSGWWVNIYKPSYLVNLVSGQRLEMISAFNVPLAPQRHYLKSFGDSLCFTLVFPQVPKDWLIFKFVEGGTPENSLSSGPITRNKSGVYNVIVS